MNTKKAGLVAAGVLTALVAASPLAWATDGGDAGKACQFVGGNSSAASSIPGGSFGNAVTQAPVGGNNAGNAGNCSDFLNGNLNGNLSGNDVNLLGPDTEPVDGGPAPIAPVAPDAGAPAAPAVPAAPALPIP